MHRRVTVWDLVLLASSTAAVLLALAGLLYLGMYAYRDVFTKILVTVVPPLATIISWDIERNRRRRSGQRPPLSPTKFEVSVTLACLIVYVMLAYTFFENAEALFLALTSLYALAYGWWLKRRRAEGHPPVSK